MKKYLILSFFAFSLTFMSVNNTDSLFEEDITKKYPIRTHTCPNVYQFDHYYNIPGWTDEDYEEMQDSYCNNPDNQPDIEG